MGDQVINSTKKVKDLYSGNFKTLKKETKEDNRRQKTSCAYALGEPILWE